MGELPATAWGRASRRGVALLCPVGSSCRSLAGTAGHRVGCARADSLPGLSRGQPYQVGLGLLLAGRGSQPDHGAQPGHVAPGLALWPFWSQARSLGSHSGLHPGGRPPAGKPLPGPGGDRLDPSQDRCSAAAPAPDAGRGHAGSPHRPLGSRAPGAASGPW